MQIHYLSIFLRQRDHVILTLDFDFSNKKVKLYVPLQDKKDLMTPRISPISARLYFLDEQCGSCGQMTKLNHVHS